MFIQENQQGLEQAAIQEQFQPWLSFDLEALFQTIMDGEEGRTRLERISGHRSAHSDFPTADYSALNASLMPALAWKQNARAHVRTLSSHTSLDLT